MILVCGIGISQSDLIILESHVADSTRKEKAAALLYIIQRNQPNSNNLIQTPVRDAINRLAYNDQISFLFLSALPFPCQHIQSVVFG